MFDEPLLFRGGTVLEFINAGWTVKGKFARGLQLVCRLLESHEQFSLPATPIRHSIFVFREGRHAGKHHIGDWDHPPLS